MGDSTGLGDGVKFQNVDTRNSRDAYYAGQKAPTDIRQGMPGG